MGPHDVDAGVPQDPTELDGELAIAIEDEVALAAKESVVVGGQVAGDQVHPSSRKPRTSGKDLRRGVGAHRRRHGFAGSSIIEG